MKTTIVGVMALLLLCVLFTAKKTNACTTGIFNGKASANGGPILWKNRDTNTLANKAVFVKAQPYNYIGLVNADESSGRMVYAGLNSEAFGIINSVAYNLPKNEKEMQDLEGIIMADALRSCRTIADFENYIKRNLGPALGSWANFGVIDASGNAAIFEVHNHDYKIHDTSKAPKNYLVNSNFARSGAQNEGYGYLRFNRASQLFKQLEGKPVSPRFIFQTVARDFGHVLVKHPTLKQLEEQSVDQPVWIYGRDCINRSNTASVAVICGKPNRPDNKGYATFWVLLGEPLTSIAVPLWVEAGQTPAALYQGKDAPMCGTAGVIKKILRPYTDNERVNYMETTQLVNKENAGFLPLIIKTETEIFRETRRFLDAATTYTPGQLAAFQEKMAQKALETLKATVDRYKN
ncbi:MAG: hypothetical protein GY765_42205 [bacterium]|nr:hypothetical protein [bacterium]